VRGGAAIDSLFLRSGHDQGKTLVHVSTVRAHAMRLL
jgi:hypothetical protein